MSPTLITLALPEYNLRTQPDYIKIGRIVDSTIERNLPNGKYVCRAIGIDDHPGLTLDELVSIILRLGTDHYNPDRKEVCAEEFAMYDHDLHGGAFEISNHRIVQDENNDVPSMFGDMVKKFYENVLLDRGYQVRIDLLIIYDANMLEHAHKIDPTAERVRPELEECLYKFKNGEHKGDALVAVIKILR